MANDLRGELLWRKVTFVGEAGSGKTTLIKQFCEGKFSAQSHPTVGADYGHKHCTIRDMEVEVTFWDLAGSTEYRDIYKHLLPQSELCILVFDVSKLSVKSVEEWLDCVTQYLETSKLAIFINKADLIDKKQASMSIVDKVKKWLLSSKLYSNLSVYLTRGITDKEVKEYITYLLSQTLPDDTNFRRNENITDNEPTITNDTLKITRLMYHFMFIIIGSYYNSNKTRKQDKSKWS